MADDSLEQIIKLKEEQVFSDIDLEFCRFLLRMDPGIYPEALLAAGMTSYAYRQGNICISLDRQSSQPIIDESVISLPEAKEWISKVTSANVIGRPGDYKPLILDESNRLYLHKLWNYEQDLAKNIIARAVKEPVVLNRDLLEDGINRMFAPPDSEPDWQAVAAIAAVYNYLTVISGGPGTGKTTTVLKILALILEQYAEKDQDPAIALTAPTGKAAARLEESISSSLEGLNCTDEIKNSIPTKGRTLHQLLGARRDSSSFRYNEDNPLPYDIVIVDEASMVDQALMSRLVKALLNDARLILIGDKDQLASVEAGSVLGSICSFNRNRISSKFAGKLKEFSIDISENSIESEKFPLTDSIILLQKSYRFKSESGIPALAASINSGDADKALSMLKEDDPVGIHFHNFSTFENFEEELKAEVQKHIIPVLQSVDPVDMFDQLQQFQLLSPHRRGPLGVEYLNKKVEDYLKQEGLVSRFDEWYHGKPIIINQNEYSLDLNNGDIGICFKKDKAELQVLFKTKGGFNLIAPSRLPDYSPAYALTVHKSQGSEFEHVKIVLPDKGSKILTRELLYTAVTRSKSSVTISGKEQVFTEAVNAKIERSSGLKDLLWQRV